MKKRVKGLLALWFALVMTVSLPITTYAATTADVYFYTGKTALQNYDKPSAESVQLTGTEAFQVGKSLDEQYSSKIPAGYNLTGWKLWKADSGLVCILRKN